MGVFQIVGSLLRHIFTLLTSYKYMCIDIGDAPLNTSNAVQLLSKQKFEMHPKKATLF